MLGQLGGLLRRALDSGGLAGRGCGCWLYVVEPVEVLLQGGTDGGEDVAGTPVSQKQRHSCGSSDDGCDCFNSELEPGWGLLGHTLQAASSDLQLKDRLGHQLAASGSVPSGILAMSMTVCNQLAEDTRLVAGFVLGGSGLRFCYGGSRFN